MRLRIVLAVALLVLAGLALAQTADQPPAPELEVAEDSDEELQPGEAALRALAQPPLQLGADLGNACVCLCRQAAEPHVELWAYFERSIVSGCQWSGRICVVEESLGTLGACTEAPAPLK